MAYDNIKNRKSLPLYNRYIFGKTTGWEGAGGPDSPSCLKIVLVHFTEDTSQ